MMTHLLFVVWVLCLSTLWYVYLHRKTRISIKFIYSDNLIVSFFTILFCYLAFTYSPIKFKVFYFTFSIPTILGFSFIITMIRFWRTPKRALTAKPNEIVSPADGNIIYIRKVQLGETPMSIKNGITAYLSEIAQTDLINGESWIIGINMTPFDVHKNCAPVSGQVILNKHIKGSFLSLKDPYAVVRNERNTLIIRSEHGELFGVIQTASKLVRRIDTYIVNGQLLKQGDWFGMIRFGSQVDLILPSRYNLSVSVGQQVYAKKTIVASK